MPDFLRLTLAPDDDGTAELFAEVAANGFSGHGSAWFNVEAISNLATQLSKAFPLPYAIDLKGGYWGKQKEDGLTQEHLSLNFYPAKGRGVVGCQVRLATPLSGDERNESQHLVRAELLTSYQELQTFSSALTALAKNLSGEAILHAVEV